MEGIKLSDVIRFEQDITHKVTFIYAGVGAGKSYWACELMDKYRVFLVTSRAMTADIQARNKEANRHVHYGDFDKQSLFGKNENYITTNSSVANYLKKCSSYEDVDKILSSFDVIVIDEIHSLVADATYQDAPFYMDIFIRYAIEHFEGKIVFMTGTPLPIEWLYNELLDKYGENVVDFKNVYDKVKHVEPNEVILYSKSDIDSLIKRLINEDGKTYIFVSRIDQMISLVESVCKWGIDAKDIGVAMSKNSTNKLNAFPKEIRKDIKQAHQELVDSLEVHETIPDNIKIVLSTSVYKEGINIKNNDVKYMIVDSMQLSEAIQMAGRIREGFDKLYILVDTPTSSTAFQECDYLIAKDCHDKATTAFEEAKKHIKKSEEEVIAHFYEVFNYLRYNYINKSFEPYECRLKAYQQAHDDKRFINKAIDCWNFESIMWDDYYFYPFHSAGTVLTGENALKLWFKYSEVRNEVKSKSPESIEDTRKFVEEEIDRFLWDNGYVNNNVYAGDVTKILEYCNNLTKEYQYKFNGRIKRYKQLSALLINFGYTVTAIDHLGNYYISESLGN